MPRFRPGLAGFDVEVVRESEDSFGEDVALHVAGASADGEGGGEQVAVVPDADVGAKWSDIGQHRCGAGEVLGEAHDGLAVFVGEDLADRRFGSGLLASDAGGDGAQADELEDFLGGVKLCEALAQVEIVGAALFTDEVEKVRTGRAHSPQCASGGERYPFVAEGDLGEFPASVDLAHDRVGRQADLVEEHFVEGVSAGHLDDGSDLDTGQVHRAEEIGDAGVLRHVGVGAGDEDPVSGVLGERGPDLLTGHHPFVTITNGAGAEIGEVAAGFGFREELAPDVLPRQQSGQIALFLLLGAGVNDGGSGPSDADHVRWTAHTCSTELVVDDQLLDRVGVEPPWSGQVRCDVSGFGQVPPGRFWIRLEPGPNLSAERVVLGWEIEVHVRNLAGLDRAVKFRAGFASHSDLLCAGNSYADCPRRRRSQCETSVTHRFRPPMLPAIAAEENHMAGWNFAEIWERIAERLPDAPAQAHAGEQTSWRSFDERANGVAHALIEAGAAEQDKVALYLYNDTTYMEATFAALKAGLVPVNTNYRYADEELVYLWDNSDAVAVVFHGVFTETIERIRDRMDKVRLWLWVNDGSGPMPDWAMSYEDAAAGHPERVVPAWGRDGDHLLMLYTGGTTGMPKGVMWRQDDLIRNVLGSSVNPRFIEDPIDYDAVLEPITAPGMVGLPACPLMHGTGMFTQLAVLSSGGCVVTLTNRTFDIGELFDTIEAEGVNLLAIVGDAFAKPMANALDASPDKWDLGSLNAITSSGVMFSEDSKQRLLHHVPGMLILDAFSSSEALGMGSSVSAAGAATSTAKFTIGPNAKVFTHDLREVEPGSGEVGRMAVGGFQPVGYYKDPAKSTETFLEVDGRRYSVPGDFATVEIDGTITLLGRGSVCINTGGEKVFPEEVEEAMKTHPSVADAVAVGVPDDRFGEAVTAVVELRPDADFDEAALIEHVKRQLAAYKAPKRVLIVPTIGRAPNGKVDYKRIKTEAREILDAG